MSIFLKFAVLGLGTGAIYALAAQGIVLVYRGSGVLNFAHGAIALVGAASFVQLRSGVPTPVAFMGAVGICGGLGVIIQLGVLRPLRRSSALTRLIATLGLLEVIQQGADLKYGQYNQYIPSFLPTTRLRLFGDVTVGIDRLAIFGIACALTVLLWAIYSYSRFGLATAALAEDEDIAAAQGWSPGTIALVNWGVGAALAGAAGVLLVPITGLDPAALSLIVIPALAAALLGSFSSFPLTLAGGLMIGVLEAELNQYVSAPGWANTAPFLMVIVVMVIRGRALPMRSHMQDMLPALGSGRVRTVPILCLTGIAITSTFVLSQNWAAAMTTTAIVAVIGMSLVVLSGYCGQISLAQYAFAGIGAFAAGRAAQVYGVPFPVALLISVAAAIPLGMVVGLIALRTRGMNLAIATIGMAVAVEDLVLSNPRYTGGPVVGTVVPGARLGPLDLTASAQSARYATAAIVVLVLVGLAVANLRRGAGGRSLIAVRNNELAAASLGLNVTGTKLFAFSVAAAIAGVGGGLMAFQQSSLQYVQFASIASVTLVLYVVIGGMGFIAGPILGALIAPDALIQEILGRWINVNGDLGLAAGILLVANVIANPDGMASALARQAAGIASRLDAKVFGPRSARGLARRGRGRQEALVGGEAGSTHRACAQSRGPMLRVTDLTVRFGSVVAVDRVTLEIERGRVLGIIGPNGAGKTTLLDAVTGYVPSSGLIELEGHQIQDWPTFKRARAGIGRSFQTLELFDDLTVGDNLLVAAQHPTLGRSLTDLVHPANEGLPQVAVDVARMLGLTDHLELQPRALSYGQRRLLAIARALAGSPSLILLDEPAAGLDTAESMELSRLIRHMADRLALSVILIEHDMDVVMAACDEVAVLNFGSMIALGAPDVVCNERVVMEAYLGTPGAFSRPEAAEGDADRRVTAERMGDVGTRLSKRGAK